MNSYEKAEIQECLDFSQVHIEQFLAIFYCLTPF